MLRPFLIAALIAPALLAQTPEQRFKNAWANYAKFDFVGDVGKDFEAGLPEAMDELGSAWSAWAEARGPAALELPALPVSKNITGPSTQILARRGPWVLLGLEVPVPCGSHLFIALFETGGSRWTLTMLDLHEPRDERDPLGARENAQALLLNGPKVVIASTPPWCVSCWSVLHARALASGVDPEHSRLLAHFEDGIYRCTDGAPFTMKVVKSGVRFSYTGGAGERLIGKGQTEAGHRRILHMPEK